MSVVFVFIDGMGVGERAPENPLSNNGWDSFSPYTDSAGLDASCKTHYKNSLLYKPIDATLGVAGLPQSGTGQTTLFSGVNASKIAGKHFGPYPYSTTRYLLEKESLFHKMIEMGKNPVFMNAYPEIFFKKARKKNRWTATTLMTKSAGVPLKSVNDILKGSAVTAEIIQNIWREHLGLNVPEISVEEAAQRLLSAANIHDLILYEFYLTDKAGHSMDREYADRIRDLLNPFLNYLAENLAKMDTLVITSDHGNLEDLSIKTHTLNSVPLFVKGEVDFFKSSESIMDVTPSILNLFK